jgi:hypothetical protein
MTVTVSLRITSPVMPAALIVSGVGMTPSRAWSKGDARTTPKGQPLEGVRYSSYATFPLVRKRRSLLTDVLAECEERLADRATVFEAIRGTGGTTELFIGWFLDRSGGDTLPTSLMMSLAKLGLALSFDIYPSDTLPTQDEP